MESVVIGGVDLSHWYEVVNVVRPLPTIESKLTRVEGADGYLFGGADYVPKKLSFTLVAIDKSAAALREAARVLATALLGREPVSVAFSSDNGRYYRCVQTDALVFGEHVNSASIEVVMQPLDAFMHGCTRKVTMPSGGSATFSVGGTYPTKPTIKCFSMSRDTTLDLWGVTLDDGDYIDVPATSNPYGGVTIDCADRTCTLGTNVAMISLGSDWFTLEPGVHTIEARHGTGATTITFEERWL